MGKAFDLSALMGDPGAVSKVDTGGPDIRMIDVGLIDPNEDNFFAIESDLTDLIESIQVSGLLQPLLVRPTDGGRYRLIAGHRRRMAILKLCEQDAEKWKFVPCAVVTPESPEMEQLMLIQTNTASRELSWNEKTKAIEKTEQLLVKLQTERGVQLPGKMRTTVAKILKTSESQIARAKVIKKGLAPEFKKLGDKINESAAYSLARLEPEDQRKLYAHWAKKGTWWGALNTKTVSDYKKAIEAGRDPFAPPPKEPRSCYEAKSKDGKSPPCLQAELIARKSKKAGDDGCKCQYESACCCSCAMIADCTTRCKYADKKLEATKKTPLWTFAQRLRAARETTGMTRKELEERLREAKPNTSSDITQFENAKLQPAFTSLLDLSRVLGCSADYLLGLTEQMRAVGWQAHIPSKEPANGQVIITMQLTNAGWHAGVGIWREGKLWHIQDPTLQLDRTFSWWIDFPYTIKGGRLGAV